MIPLDVLTHQLRYTEWASNRLLATASILAPSELTRDFGTAHKSVLETLVHVFGADRLWYNRLRMRPPYPPYVEDRDNSLAALASEWPTVHRRWLEWAATLSPESISAPIEYEDLKGRPWTTPAWQILLHVVNHATHHRGQASGFLRAMNHTPPVLDLMAYYRELQQ